MALFPRQQGSLLSSKFKSQKLLLYCYNSIVITSLLSTVTKNKHKQLTHHLDEKRSHCVIPDLRCSPCDKKIMGLNPDIVLNFKCHWALAILTEGDINV